MTLVGIDYGITYGEMRSLIDTVGAFDDSELMPKCLALIDTLAQRNPGLGPTLSRELRDWLINQVSAECEICGTIVPKSRLVQMPSVNRRRLRLVDVCLDHVPERFRGGCVSSG